MIERDEISKTNPHMLEQLKKEFPMAAARILELEQELADKKEQIKKLWKWCVLMTGKKKEIS